MKYKVGDKVRVKSLDWIKENCEYDDILKCFIYKEEYVVFTESMQKFCEQVVTICDVNDTAPFYYVIEEDKGVYTLLFADWMLEEIGDESET